MPNQLNSKGKETALSKIRAGDVDETSDWSFGADDENALLGDPPDWDRYSSWHMGIDPDTAEETKERFKYPFGKDGKVYRSALRAIRSRAAQQGEQEISDAARDCMDEMDMMHEGEDGSKNVRRGRAWYSLTIARSQGGEQTEADLRVFDVIGQSFWGEETVTAKQFIADLMALPQSVKTIRVHVNSPGGDVFDAVAIANALKGHPARIEMTIEGLAASAATIVTMAGDVISIAENALMMIHNPWSIVIGGADDMRKEAEALDRVRDSIVATYRWHSQLPAERLAELMQAITWMDAEEAIANGFATEIGEPVKAAAHLDEKMLAKLGPVPEKYRERVAALRPTAAPAAVQQAQPEPPAPDAADPVRKGAEVIDLEKVRQQARDGTLKSDRERVAGIRAIARALRLEGYGDQLAADGLDVETARAKLHEKLAADGPEIVSQVDPVAPAPDKPRIASHADIYERRRQAASPSDQRRSRS